MAEILQFLLLLLQLHFFPLQLFRCLQVLSFLLLGLQLLLLLLLLGARHDLIQLLNRVLSLPCGLCDVTGETRLLGFCYALPFGVPGRLAASGAWGRTKRMNWEGILEFMLCPAIACFGQFALELHLLRINALEDGE